MRAGVAAAAVAVLLSGLASSASAALFDFSYSGAGIAASGTFTTNDTPDGNGFFTITAVDGTRNGQAMVLLAPDTFPADGPNDNLVQPDSNFFDFNGLGFSTDQDYNVFQFSAGVYVECFDTCLAGNPNEVFLDQVSVTRDAGGVPEPASWALMLSGFGLAGAMLRRRHVALAA